MFRDKHILWNIDVVRAAGSACDSQMRNRNARAVSSVIFERTLPIMASEASSLAASSLAAQFKLAATCLHSPAKFRNAPPVGSLSELSIHTIG